MATTYVEAEAEAKARTLAANADAKIAVRDAETDRKIRAAAAEADLEARRIANRAAEREAKSTAKSAETTRKTEARRTRRAARAARRTAAVARVTAYVAGNMPGVYSAGIYAMALYVAVSGQIGVATDRGWPIAIGIGMAAFLEGTALAMALTAHQQRLKGERALTPRIMTWVAAGFAAAINFGAHADDMIMAAVLGSSSLAAIVVWEVRSGAKHRDALRKLGLIPDPPERFGWRRWVRYPRSTFAAWSLDVRSRVGTGAAALLATVEADRAAAEATAKAEHDAKAAEKAARQDAIKLARSEAKAAKAAKEGKTDASKQDGPVKPPRARTGTAKAVKRNADDATLVARLRTLAAETGTAVSINRARTDLKVGTGRAKRLLSLAADSSFTVPSAD
ncbi:DUF2637 domain-containing protein [Glycomyces harbinensis]|uniref:DUF2637 domain-containing protein n=1 Tax=Glycomyces harbinensis TaxID=58114 RepID=A0A1G6YU42_9ACTN|nr:DUF2637 domain-containing protein [Glycomyces harbinensis]SDD94034.1 Protein of unknown function [Glycomyces harbinensis]